MEGLVTEKEGTNPGQMFLAESRVSVENPTNSWVWPEPHYEMGEAARWQAGPEGG